MINAARYFKLAYAEETKGSECAALLLYLSSFCDSLNSAPGDYPCGTVAKIRSLQNRLFLSDLQLLSLVHSYGPFTDAECRKLLSYSICGSVTGIRAILASHDGTMEGSHGTAAIRK